jgi:hypothetical protein
VFDLVRQEAASSDRTEPVRSLVSESGRVCAGMPSIDNSPTCSAGDNHGTQRSGVGVG